VKLGIDAQPVNNVEWIHRDCLRANSYNPNHVAPPEMRLLRISILEDGWTQPLVVRETDRVAEYEIVDGFHRYTVSGESAIYAMTGGRVPCVVLVPDDPEMSTIRHNRARGQHEVLKMADIVSTLLARGISAQEIERRLQMEDEEVSRLADRGNMVKRGSRETFNAGWVPGQE
jgi:ParB-like chromosome segregation protein Spo0J